MTARSDDLMHAVLDTCLEELLGEVKSQEGQ
jgi:hypothetical protein